MRSKHLAKLLGAAVTAIAAVAMMAPVAQAATPAPGYGQFTGCPSAEENSLIEFCLHALIKSGHFQMGSKDVPITNPIPMIGGTDQELENFANTADGGLRPVKQPVPGGVIGLTGLDWLVNFLNVEQLKLYAVTEAVGAPKLTLETIDLPIRVHLINQALGNKCYVGSASSPISLHLTTGTTSPPPPNEPISGEEGVLTVDPPETLVLSDAKYVDNSFSAPGASGCTLTLLGILPVSLNGLVNAQAGLPAAAGTNETIQIIDTEIAPEDYVYP